MPVCVQDSYVTCVMQLAEIIQPVTKGGTKGGRPQGLSIRLVQVSLPRGRNLVSSRNSSVRYRSRSLCYAPNGARALSADSGCLSRISYPTVYRDPNRPNIEHRTLSGYCNPMLHGPRYTATVCIPISVNAPLFTFCTEGELTEPVLYDFSQI